MNLWIVPATQSDAPAQMLKSLSQPIPSERRSAAAVEGERYAWGVEASDYNKNYFDTMSPGDWCLLRTEEEGQQAYRWLAQIQRTVRSGDVAQALWDDRVRELVFFLTPPRRIQMTPDQLADRLSKYQPGYRPPAAFQPIGDAVIGAMVDDLGSISGWVDRVWLDAASVEDRWLQIMRFYHEHGVVFYSLGESAPYCVASVDDAGCEVERIGRGTNGRCTKSQLGLALGRVRDAGGTMPFSPEFASTVAIRTAYLHADCFVADGTKSIRLLESDGEALHLLTDALSAMRVDRSSGKPKLYKPAMMYAVLEEMEPGGLLSEAELIDYQTMIEPFERVMAGLGEDADGYQAAYAFYHLASEPFWNLAYHAPENYIATNSNLTPKLLRARVRGACLKEPFRRLLRDPFARREARKYIRETWWPSAPAVQIDERVLRAAVDQTLRPVLIELGYLDDVRHEGYHHQRILPRAGKALTDESVDADAVEAVREAFKVSENLISKFEWVKLRDLLDASSADEVHEQLDALFDPSQPLEPRAQRMLEWGAKRTGPEGNELSVNATVVSYLLAMRSPTEAALCKPEVYKTAVRALLGSDKIENAPAARIAHATAFYRAALEFMRDTCGLPLSDLHHVHIAFFVMMRPPEGYPSWDELIMDQLPFTCWWVNQGQTWTQERDGRFIWAPIENDKGKRFFHWTNVSEVKQGDVVFHYVKQSILAVSLAEADAFEGPKPEAMADTQWSQKGRRCDVAIEELAAPVPGVAIAGDIHRLIDSHGPVNRSGGANQGYLYNLNRDAAAVIASKIDRAGLSPRMITVLDALESKTPPPPSPIKDPPKMKPRNIILYGPPGTGKTYHTTDLAVRLCDGSAADDLDRAQIVARYQELLAEKRIAFVTFHQSYGYEEFVEGIRPVLYGGTESDEGDGADTDAVRYECKSGVFKRICALANVARRRTTLPAADAPVDWDTIRVWKMSLGESGNEDHEPIYQDCIDEGYVRLGWGGAIDFDGCDNLKTVKTHLREQAPDTSKLDSEAGQVNKLKNKMSVGDLVIVSDGNLKFRAIAEVTGDYEVLDRDEYQQARSVKWLNVLPESLPHELVYKKRFRQWSIDGLDKSYINQSVLTDLIAGADKAEPQESLSRESDAVGPVPFVLVIDEINRGNISRILGELITLIEHDKRLGQANELKVTLPYSGDEFGVPANLHLIGTMNTADRSIAFLDTALRRRFEFQEMMPEASVIREQLPGGGLIGDIDVASFLEVINRRVELLYDRDHQIGHAYLLGVKTLTDLRRVMLDKVIPLLQEYFFEDWEKLCAVLGCPYGVDATKTLNRNDSPIITAKPLLANLLTAGDDLEVEDRISYEVNADFRDAKASDLKPYFLGIIDDGSATK